MPILLPNIVIETIMQEVVEKFLIPRFHQLNMNATGEWLESLQVSAQYNRGEINGAHYSEQLEHGRAPGAMPPIAPLERWAEAKLGLYGSDARSAAFAIAKKIADEGTSWYQKGGSNLLDVLSEAETLTYVNQRIGAEYTVIVQQEILQRTKNIFAYA